jgi:hypothetical protein
VGVVSKLRSFIRRELDTVKDKNDEQDAAVREALQIARQERLRMILEIRSHR